MNFKTLALAAVTAVTTTTMAPAPAEAFWGPSDAQVCKSKLASIENLRTKSMGVYGASVVWSGTVVPSSRVSDLPSMGYKFVTGCTTQFTVNGTRYIQSANVEVDTKTNQYYFGVAPALALQGF